MPSTAIYPSDFSSFPFVILGTIVPIGRFFFTVDNMAPVSFPVNFFYFFIYLFIFCYFLFYLFLIFLTCNLQPAVYTLRSSTFLPQPERTILEMFRGRETKMARIYSTKKKPNKYTEVFNISPTSSAITIIILKAKGGLFPA